MRYAIVLSTSIALVALGGPPTASAYPDQGRGTGGNDKWSGNNAPATKADKRVIRNATEWKKFWGWLHTPEKSILGQERKLDVPEVNFEEKMVVIVLAGSGLTGGYGIEITDVQPSPRGVTVRYQETVPQRTTHGNDFTVTSQAASSPYAVAVVPRVDGPVTFVRDARPRK